eukprot:1159891-Pelagomonas_calceolata.AAC.9
MASSQPTSAWYMETWIGCIMVRGTQSGNLSLHAEAEGVPKSAPYFCAVHNQVYEHYEHYDP